MKFRLLSDTERKLYRADAMAVVDYTDVAALGAATTGNLNVMPATTAGAMPAAGTSGTDTIPAGFEVRFERMIVDTAFVSASAAGLAVTIGDAGSNNRFMASSQLQSGQTPVAAVVGITNRYYIATAETINAYFTSTTANLNTFTAGSARILFSLLDLAQLPTT